MKYEWKMKERQNEKRMMAIKVDCQIYCHNSGYDVKYWEILIMPIDIQVYSLERNTMILPENINP